LAVVVLVVLVVVLLLVALFFSLGKAIVPQPRMRALLPQHVLCFELRLVLISWPAWSSRAIILIVASVLRSLQEWMMRAPMTVVANSSANSFAKAPL
jgi:hypothetical protein